MRKRRILAGAVLAALGETVVLCVPIGNSVLKIAVGYGGITMILILWLFRPQTREGFGRSFIYYYLSAGILGGVLHLTELIFYKKKISVWVLCAGISLAAEAAKEVYLKMRDRNALREVELILSGDKKCTVTALIDSGNGLVEPISKMPVSIVESRILEDYRQELKEENFRIVPFHSVGKDKGILEAYYIDSMEIKKEGESVVIKKPMIAITNDNISVREEYQMLLHPALLEPQ